MADSKTIWSPSPDSDEESFFRASLGTPLPSDALDVLHSNFEGHGNCGEDGLKVNVTRSTTKHRNWGGKIVHVTTDEVDSTVSITFLEQTPNVLATVFGDASVEVDLLSGHRKMTVRSDGDELPRSSFVARAVEGDKTVMYVIPEGQVTEVDEFEVNHSTMLMYVVTIDCFTPPTGTLPDNPASINIYYDEPSVTSGT